MKSKLFCYFVIISGAIFSQENKQIDLSEFNLSNTTSPAFVLISESPTDVYIPENLKSLTIHALNNFDGSLSLEVAPYYFINANSKDRSFFRYVGIQKKEDKYSQNPFSGINTTTISVAYANKEFENLVDDNRKVFSVGLRTKLLRFYNKSDVISYYNKVSEILQNIEYPNKILLELLAAQEDEDKQTEIINTYFKSEEGVKHLKSLEIYRKPIKPIFQIDFSAGYSSLFKENKIDSNTLNRFGTWLTSEFSLILNKDSETSKTNNYFNVFIIGRYIEDEFNQNESALFYRDFGGKIEFELGGFKFGYEFIERNGSIDNDRSVGTITYLINKNLSINGGFGKDFNSEEDLVTLFGINWGINTLSN